MTILDRINWWMFNVKILVAKFLMKHGIVPSMLSRDFVKNPLLKYPRNLECWCGSNKRSKNCCLPKQARVCRIEHAKILNQFMTHIELATSLDG
jgi:hypothetical protein